MLNTGISCELWMDDEIESLYRELNDYMQRNSHHIGDDIRQFKVAAAESHLVYAGKPLAIGFYPVILSSAQSLHIATVVEAMIRLMEKATGLFLQEPAFRQAFGFEPKQVELIEIDPGYEDAIPCGRFDSFFDGKSVRFTEFNTDGTAGMDGAEKIAKLFLAAPTMHEFFSDRPITTFGISHCVLQTLLDCYRQYVGGKTVGTPRIAIVDWKEARTYAEFVAFAEFCRGQGYEAVVADPRELDYDGHVLSHHGLRIDIIYRRVVSAEYVERLEEVEAMTRAFRDHNVCVVGSFRSDVAFSKRALGLAHSPKFAHFFTRDEQEFAKRHMPWTQPFEDSECEYGGRKVGMLDLARQERKKFVLKPSNLYEGRGVVLGAWKNADEWEDVIAEALKNDYVLQELIPIPCMPVGVWEDDFELKKRFVHLGEYMFGGKFCGFYCRMAEGPLIDRSSREVLVPCFVLGK